MKSKKTAGLDVENHKKRDAIFDLRFAHTQRFSDKYELPAVKTHGIKDEEEGPFPPQIGFKVGVGDHEKYSKLLYSPQHSFLTIIGPKRPYFYSNASTKVQENGKHTSGC